MKKSALSRILNFTEDDLMANQRGQLSEGQRSHLRSQMVLWGSGGGLMFVIMGIAFIGLLTVQLDLLSLIGMAVVFVLMLVFGAGTWFEISERWFDLRKGVVLSATGAAEPYIRTRIHGNEYYALKIGVLEFKISSPAYYVFDPGNRYQVFYTPTAKAIVSAIQLDDASSEE
ncbi:MAG: hypothetical protein ABI690_22595 [Chloroflexota bacterium]